MNLAQTRSQRRRVLVIDDEPYIARALKRALDRMHDVDIAQSGRSAMDLIRTSPPYHVLFCDLMMPGMDGIDVFDELARVSPALRARTVFMTGGAHGDRAQTFIKGTTVPLLDKPFDIDEVMRLVVEVGELSF